MKIFPVKNMVTQYNYNDGNCNKKNNTNPSMMGAKSMMLETYVSESQFTLIKKWFKNNFFTNKAKAEIIQNGITPKKPTEAILKKADDILYLKTPKQAIQNIINSNLKKASIVERKYGEYEKFYYQFDPVEHQDRIYADFFDSKKILHHTTVYDLNGLKMSQFYEKPNSSKDPITKRIKIFDVNEKMVHEDINYKNGDIGTVDYDYVMGTNTNKTHFKNGGEEVVVSGKYHTETTITDKDGNITYHNGYEF